MNNLSYTQILKARNDCAYLIGKYGEVYLPIFERLENELTACREKQELLHKVEEINNKTVQETAQKTAQEIFNKKSFNLNNTINTTS